MAVSPHNLQSGAPRHRYKGGPKIAGMEKHDLSAAAKEISQFIRHFETSRALEGAEGVRAGQMTASSLMESVKDGLGVNREKSLQKTFGWYWEPLYHDLAFYEEMRDSVATLAGAYEAFADFCMSGFTVSVGDPKENKRLQQALFNYKTNFREVLRRSLFEIASIGNSWCIPHYKSTFADGFTVVFQPVRATAMRVLRDEQLQTEGYVQLLHRPTEFLSPNAPSTPTLYLPEEVCWGYTYTKHWYAYGAPPFASLPFVVRLKLTMERDIAEILHKHVPRIDVTYTPEQQMTQEKVDAHIDDLKKELAGMSASQDAVHTPDVELEYIGPNGKMVDATGTQNHVEDQLFYVLPITPDMLGASIVLNPEQVQERWRIMTMRAANVRNAASIQFDPVMEALQKGLKLSEKPQFNWDSLNEQTEKTQAETHELQINNANTMRDSGLISQDEAARHATKKSSEPRQDAAEKEPTDTYGGSAAAPPSDGTPGASGKTKNKDKGPSGKKTPKTDPRPGGKRHALDEVFDGIFTAAIERIRDIGAAGIMEAIFGEGEGDPCLDESDQTLPHSVS